MFYRHILFSKVFHTFALKPGVYLNSIHEGEYQFALIWFLPAVALELRNFKDFTIFQTFFHSFSSY